VASPWLWLSLVMVVVSAVEVCLAAPVCRHYGGTSDAQDLAGSEWRAPRRAPFWLQRGGHWLARTSCWPGLARLVRVSLRLHFLHGDSFTCDDRTGCRNVASLMSLWPILWGSHVLRMGV